MQTALGHTHPDFVVIYVAMDLREAKYAIKGNRRIEISDRYSRVVRDEFHSEDHIKKKPGWASTDQLVY
jgi:hypothetical protein